MENNSKDFKANNFEYKIIINYGKETLTFSNLLQLIYLDYLNQNRFSKDIKNIVSLSFQEIPKNSDYHVLKSLL